MQVFLLPAPGIRPPTFHLSDGLLSETRKAITMDCSFCSLAKLCHLFWKLSASWDHEWFVGGPAGTHANNFELQCQQKAFVLLPFAFFPVL